MSQKHDWEFISQNKLAGETELGALCKLNEHITVFEPIHPQRKPPSNITLVIRENEYFLILEPGSYDVGCVIYHPRHGYGMIHVHAKVEIHESSRYINVE